MTIKKNDPLRLDVSYLIHQAPGTERTFDLDFPFLHFEPDLDLLDVVGEITVSVTEDGVLVEGELTALTQLECTRCLAPYKEVLEINFTELYSHDTGQEDIGQTRLPPDGMIDLRPLLREYALLDIPIRHLCSADCKGLCPVCGVNRNEKDCGHKQETIDPRMAKLKELLDEDEMEEIQRE